MNTPIYDFVNQYIAADTARLHMPGHKGRGPLGCEARDITEVSGADALFEASGIIAESEENASSLFGARTFYSAEGSSLCVKAMLSLAMNARRDRRARPVALAARNAHKAFLYAAALCDFDVEWLYPEEAGGSLCACPLSPKRVAAKLDGMARRPFCLYVTSPDYLGGLQDIEGLAALCHARGVPLLVDNAHGAYLKFLPSSLHPMDLGADMCCDSAHKTLPALTGAACLHVSRGADPAFAAGAKAALSLFGSTSPSYLILQSLDLCNARLAGDFPAALVARAEQVAALKALLAARGYEVAQTEPMKITLNGAGFALARQLRDGGVECEYADRDHVVLMFSPDNREADFARIERALDGRKSARGKAPDARASSPCPPPRAMTIREAIFSRSELVPASAAMGRVCAAPTVSCPPAVPIVISGEVITAEEIASLRANGIERIRVVCAE